MRRSVLGRGAASLCLLAVLAACADFGTAPRPHVVAIGPTDVLMAGATPAPTAATQAAAPARRFQRPGTYPSSPDGDELAFVTDILTQMQVRSYATGNETCGYVGRDAQGRMMATPINTGREASCLLPRIPPGMQTVASIHTHGTYSPAYASEFPTVQDMTTDAHDGINGYISTPGGRLWYVDTVTMTVRQLCGRGCLPQDPHYRPEDDGPVRPMFTVGDLRAWESS
ncbi:MAG: DUF4329 domain-containing protein [Rubellimicrobium sp.]|nr:DUF4329 domain-containing protein [Rubellimicrobium sp.]